MWATFCGPSFASVSLSFMGSCSCMLALGCSWRGRGEALTSGATPSLFCCCSWQPYWHVLLSRVREGDPRDISNSNSEFLCQMRHFSARLACGKHHRDGYFPRCAIFLGLCSASVPLIFSWTSCSCMLALGCSWHQGGDTLAPGATSSLFFCCSGPPCCPMLLFE